jgi:hypothetical protein
MVLTNTLTIDTAATSVMADVYENSKKVAEGVMLTLTTVQDKDQRTYLKKRSRTSAPIKCWTLFFYFKQSTKLEVFALVANVVACILLTF